jgi:hypothetical protein
VFAQVSYPASAFAKLLRLLQSVSHFRRSSRVAVLRRGYCTLLPALLRRR